MPFIKTILGRTEHPISGEPPAQLKSTFPVKPFSGVKVRAAVPFAPGASVRVWVEDDKEKFGAEDGGLHSEIGTQEGAFPMSLTTKVIEPFTVIDFTPIKLILPPAANVTGPLIP
jgi:hypothetical protein